MKRLALLTVLALLFTAMPHAAFAEGGLVWPPAPDEARIEYIGDIRCEDLSPGSSLLGKFSRLVGGHKASDDISLPFAPLVVGRDLFLVCQNIPSLIRINRSNNSFRLIEDKEKSLRYPIALARGAGEELYLSDGEAASVYRYLDGELTPFVTTGLTRPTGIAVDARAKRIYVVDTGEHLVRVFDLAGVETGSFPNQSDTNVNLSFPIAVAVTATGATLVNDALNYQIKRFSSDGILMGAFGFEGDTPGAFARPKGIAIDSDDHVYVVDNLFDNFQVFDEKGTSLLAVGSAGQAPGEFWSPAGIDIVADTLFIADTYNNRIQMFRYLGGAQ